MQMTTEARLWLDETVRRILARHPLGDAERAGITYELMSHLHAAGEAHARAASRVEVSREDLQTALTEAGGEAGLAAAFVQPLAKPLEPAPLGRRLGALAIDAVLLGVVISFVHGALASLLRPLGGVDPEASARHWDWEWMPWGFHDLGLALWVQALIALASGAVLLGYFTWFEGHEGRSLGKRALDLRVMRADGKPMTYREAFLRNLAKLSPPLLFLDALFMLLLFHKEKQRVSDRLAGTLVVRA